MKDLYEILGLDKSATAEEIQQAYKRRAKESHPDAGGDTDMFHLVAIAGEVLRDRTRRQEYDETGNYEANPTSDEGKAEKLLVQTFFGVYTSLSPNDIEHSDLIVLAVKELHKVIEQQKAEKGLFVSNMELQKKVIKRLTHKKKKGNGLLIRAIKENIIGLERDIFATDKQLKLIDEAIQIATEYEYDFDEMVEEMGLGSFGREKFNRISNMDWPGGG